MIELGQMTTGKNHNVKYLWLLKDMDIFRKYSKEECYVVMASNGDGWWIMFNGTLEACRDFIGNETVVDV